MVYPSLVFYAIENQFSKATAAMANRRKEHVPRDIDFKHVFVGLSDLSKFLSANPMGDMDFY